jgi:uncharacterized protein
MGRLILLGLLVVLVVWLLRRALAGPRSRGGAPGQAPEQAGGAGELVSCAHCGVNLPKSEARSAGGRHYCSEEHWRGGPRDG